MFLPVKFPPRLVWPLKIFVFSVFLPGISTASAQLAPGIIQSSGLSPKERLERIVLPSVEFHGTTLSAAVDFLRSEANRLDPDPDPVVRSRPGYRSVNIIVKLPAASTPQPRITLTLHHIPLSEALKYVAIQAGMKVRVEPYAVSLVPMTEDVDPLITATFRVAPGLFGNKTEGGRPDSLSQGATPAQ